MTDQELIQLLHEKPASEFTPSETELLRARWTQSPELRQALVEHLELETQLAGALGRVELDVDTILRRAAEHQRRDSSSAPKSWRWIVGLSLALLAIGGGALWLGSRQQKTELAQLENTQPVKNTTSDVTTSSESLMDGADSNSKDKSAETAVANAILGKPVDASSDVGAVNTGDRPATASPSIVEPWAEALSRDVAPWPANSPKLTRDFKASGHDELPEAEAKRWFSQVEGQPFNWGQDVYGPQHKRVARFQGLARLRSPWPGEAMLRLTPFDVTDMTIYLWRGPQGIALRFYTRREPFLWAAFLVTRENSSPKPLSWSLLTTDNGGYSRSGLGTFDIRFQDRGVVLARGGIPLLSAPMSTLPDEVYVEGQFRLRGISIHKVAPFPSIPPNVHTLVLGDQSANELPWAMSAELPAQLDSNDDGSVTFTADSRNKAGLVCLPIGRGGLFEVIARVESADPGTGIFLGDLNGRPLQQLGFFKDNATGQTTFGVLRPGEQRDTSQFDINAFPPPYLARGYWLKIISGLGAVQVLASGDGHHWGHIVENPARDLPGAVASVGLYGLAGPVPRTMRIARLEVRELVGVTRLADNRLVSLSPKFAVEDWKDVASWTHRVLDTKPVDVELSQWFTACAVASLTQGPTKEFGVALLKRLVAIGVRSNALVGAKLQLLEDASLLCDLWEDSSARPIALHYEEIAQQLAAAGDPHPLETVRPALIRSPMWTLSKLRYAWERENTRELILAAYRNDWPDVWQTSQTATFWNAGAHPDWRPTERSEDLEKYSRWLRALAAENLPQLDDGTAGVLPGSWRHPLALQWNKEAYNVRSELQSALAGQSYEDACRIVMSIGNQDGPGLLPDMDDRQLFVSLPTAVASAIKSHPEFARLMSDKFGPLGLIRVRQATQSGDVRGVQAATLQFYGTAAAVEAHQWLGDRDLSAGRFPAAEEHFLLGLQHALPHQRESLEARLRLAAALNGQKILSAPAVQAGPIEISGTAISVAEYEALINDLAGKPSSAIQLGSPSNLPSQSVPAPAAYKLETRATFDGQPGNNPGRAEYRSGDPFGRQLAVATDTQRIYVSNRFQVNAYQLPGGRQQWAQGLGAEQGEAYGLPFTPMRPLIAGDRLFVRRLTKGGVELACLKSDDGQVIWHQRPNLHVISDPVIWNGSLFALTLSKLDDDLVQVEATRFDFDTGVATSNQPLFRMKDHLDRSAIAQLSLADRLAICTVGGATVCFDGGGNVHWLRRHHWIPRTVDELAEDFRVISPQVIGDHVVVSLPGVRSVSCLQIDTGRLVWERPLADMRGIAAVGMSRVLVDTADGLTALSLKDGVVTWTRPLETKLESLILSERMVVVAHRVKIAGNKTKPFLMWLDLESGRELGQSQLDGSEREEWQLGPLTFASDKWWALAGQGWKDPKRELCELVVSSPLVPGSLADQTLGPWQADLPETQAADMALVLPGWFPAANYSSRYKFGLGDVRGETFVLSSKLVEERELRFVSEFDVPVGRKTTLQLRVGNQPERRWLLAVRADNQTIHEQVIEDAGSAGSWHDVSVDLSSFAGRKVPIQLIQAAPKQHHSEVFWKRAVIVVE